MADLRAGYLAFFPYFDNLAFAMSVRIGYVIVYSAELVHSIPKTALFSSPQPNLSPRHLPFYLLDTATATKRLSRPLAQNGSHLIAGMVQIISKSVHIELAERLTL